METMLPHKLILNSSIRDMLASRRPGSSALRRLGKIGLFSIVSAAGLTLLPSRASAQTVIDFSSLSPGTPISTQYSSQGVVFALENAPGVFGIPAIGGSPYLGGLSNSPTGVYPTQKFLEFNFNAPVNIQSFVFNNYGNNSLTTYTALGAGGKVLATGNLGSLTAPNSPTTITVNVAGVTELQFSNGEPLGTNWEFVVDSFKFTLGAGAITSTLSAIPGISPNLVSVGKGLDSAASDARAAKIFAVLSSDSLPKLVSDVDRINPDKLTSMSTIGGATSGIHANNLQLRMQALQSGATGFSAMGFHVTDNTPTSTATDTTATGYAGPSGPEGKGGKEVVPPPAQNRWGSFITGSGEFTSIGDTSSARGYNLDSGGITLGVDYRFTDHFVAGVFAGYTYTGIDIADGRISVDTGKFGLYGTYFDGGFYVNSAVQGGYDAYETNRGGLGGTAHSAAVGGDLNVLFAPGYNWTMGGLTFGPTSRFQYSYQSVNGFTESGSLAPLKVDSEHSDSIVSAVGMKASYDWKLGGTTIRPELRLEWEHEYGDVSSDVTSQLASGAGGPFTVTGPRIGRDDLHLGAGFAVVFSERLTAYAYYDGQFFRQNYDSSTVTGGFRFDF